ncbi:MAG TPA: bifunctional methylenetetrahydrofolate dehydrogenase/methenyltetrahydrofolate cyclohydrolase FolD [Candidatus Kapabacteria bacterium]|jgi:methylenetetrahydrofolate dehydrogenase (NADP+)/methenyltetrahydrofolate cyclohydrolase|nr:bifunctional methylenetetrahydrofolate dehydrogenase/methenyltetrahydrofolate cyclohydrolase FolD [Ignavibacteria bacterium]HRK60089.1 bifunctional methylenetetrahydrofolate dehydrogenase/methenyltetrahydrofolate cyclohydrolase FolD [Candidatus Kapabacteria bacterium]
MIINGKEIAQTIQLELAEKTKDLVAKTSVKPGLALLLVGDNSASQVYVRSKAKACEKIGFHSVILTLPEQSSESDVLAVISAWNNNNTIHGILVQLPLPKHINEVNVIMAIDPDKDVDGFHPVNVGKLVTGIGGFVPCTPAGIVELLVRNSIQTSGKHVVVVGRSNIVGKPIANLLYQKSSRGNAVVTICHTGASDIRYYTKQADILIAAIGVAHRITADDIKHGAVVIDVGINRINDSKSEKGYSIVGDVDYDSVLPYVSAITPVPGGVGPMTIAMLLTNTLTAAQNYAKSVQI